MDLDALALLDVEGGGRFVLSEAHTDSLTRARDLPWQDVVRALEDPVFFMHQVAGGAKLPFSQIRLLQASWSAQNGLVEGDDMRRLLWMVRTFMRPLESDLLVRGVDLSELWKARRWRRLLNLIDHLPRSCWTNQGLANNQEYAERIAAAVAERGDDGPPWTPPLVEHTPEVAAIGSVVDAVNRLTTTLIAVNSEKGSAPPKIPPYPRPQSLVDMMAGKAQRKARWSAHENLADRLLARRQQT